MSYLVVFVLDDPDLSQNVLDAWDQAGAKGITIFESTGLGRVRRAGIRDDLPLMPGLSDLFKGAETHNRTFFSVVDDLNSAHSLRDSVRDIVGNLNAPDSGLLFILPIAEVYGLNRDEQG